MKRVKILANFPITYLIQQLAKNPAIGDTIQIVGKGQADYFLILNHPGRASYIPERTAVIKMAPAEESKKFPFPFNRQDLYRDQFLYVLNIITAQNTFETDAWSTQIFLALEHLIAMDEKSLLPLKRHFLPPYLELRYLFLKGEICREFREIKKKICRSMVPQGHTPAKMIVIIPYRDREDNLEKLVPALHVYLQQIPHEIVVIEQSDQGLFNKGRLLNTGFDLYRHDDVYFCFHDVDLVPERTFCDYSFPVMPTHLSAYVSQFNYKLWYKCFGGVVLFNKADFTAVNGYSNEYWGWGCEDDDMWLRINASQNVPWTRRRGRFSSLEHLGFDEKHPVHESIKRITSPHYHKNLTRLGSGGRLNYDAACDGLNNLKYQVINRSVCDGYIKYTMNIL